MPSVITHGLVGAAGAAIISRDKNEWKKLAIPAALCAALPDADAIGFKFGVAYGSLLGHRGITHSILFAAITGFVAASLFSRKEIFRKEWFRLFAFFTIITATHGILDTFTSGGMGIALLSPIDDTRYFSPFTPIRVSPIGVRAFFSRWGAEVLKSEFTWVWLPAASIVAVKKLIDKLIRG
jgi:inner membrane protein